MFMLDTKFTQVKEFRLKLYVNNFEKVKDFYANILQFPIANEWNRGVDDKGIMFDTGSGIIELLSPDENYVPVQGCDVSLEVIDVHALWQYVQDKAIIIFSIRKNDWGDTSFCIADPEGFHLTFFTKI